MAAVGLHEFAEARPALAPRPVRVPPVLRVPQAFGRQPVAQGSRRHGQLPRRQLLAGHRQTEVRHLLAVERDRLLTQGRISPMVRRPPPQLVDKADVPVLLQPPLQAADLTHAALQQPRRLLLRPLPLQHRRHHLQSISLSLAHRDPVSVHPLSSPPGKRTVLSTRNRTLQSTSDRIQTRG
jgi:hypothetical protein